MSSPTPQERFIEVPRTARYYTLGAHGPALREVWIVCHGYGQLAASFLRAFEPIADATRMIAAPEALNRYYTDGSIGPHTAQSVVGATWMTREDRLNDIEDYIRYLDLVCAEVVRGLDREQVRLIALGFSQGAATVARWCARTAYAPDHVVLWGSLLPPDVDIAPRMFGDARLTIGAGSADGAVPSNRVEAEEARLHAAGVQCEVLRYQGGHRIRTEALLRLAETLRRG